MTRRSDVLCLGRRYPMLSGNWFTGYAGFVLVRRKATCTPTNVHRQRVVAGFNGAYGFVLVKAPANPATNDQKQEQLTHAAWHKGQGPPGRRHRGLAPILPSAICQGGNGPSADHTAPLRDLNA